MGELAETPAATLELGKKTVSAGAYRTASNASPRESDVGKIACEIQISKTLGYCLAFLFFWSNIIVDEYISMH